MYRKLLLIVVVAWLSNQAARADPIHSLEAMDAFVRDQRWGSLAGH